MTQLPFNPRTMTAKNALAALADHPDLTVAQLAERLRQEYPAMFARTRYDIHVCGGWLYGSATSATYFFPRNFFYADKPETADFILCLTRWDRDKGFEAPVYFSVERFGSPLSVVFDRRALSSDRPHLP